MIEDLGRRHLPVIDAREVLSRIENGSPVIYDHVAIAGDLDLRKIDLPRIHFERPAARSRPHRPWPAQFRSETASFWVT